MWSLKEMLPPGPSAQGLHGQQGKGTPLLQPSSLPAGLALREGNGSKAGSGSGLIHSLLFVLAFPHSLPTSRGAWRTCPPGPVLGVLRAVMTERGAGRVTLSASDAVRTASHPCCEKSPGAVPGPHKQGAWDGEGVRGRQPFHGAVTGDQAARQGSWARCSLLYLKNNCISFWLCWALLPCKLFSI